MSDAERQDGHPERSCFTFTLPNSWMLKSRFDVECPAPRGPYVVLLCQTEIVFEVDALFGRTNAAAWNGVHLGPGVNALCEMFSDEVTNRWTKLRRSPSALPACPTDIQAEALIPGVVAREKIIGVVFRSVDDLNAVVDRDGAGPGPWNRSGVRKIAAEWWNPRIAPREYRPRRVPSAHIAVPFPTVTQLIATARVECATM